MGTMAGVGGEWAVHNSPSLKSCIGVHRLSEKNIRKWEIFVNHICNCKNCESNSRKLNTGKSIYLYWKLFFTKGLKLLCRKLLTIDAFRELQMSCIWSNLNSNCCSAETSHSNSSHPFRGGRTEICEVVPWVPLRTSGERAGCCPHPWLAVPPCPLSHSARTSSVE